MNAPTRGLALAIRAADPFDRRDAARIDGFVAEHPEGTPFHRPIWSRAVAQGCRQQGHFLVAERGGVLVGLVPLTEVHSPLFGRALVSVGFAVEGGILADDPATALALERAAWALAERTSCPTLELRGGSTQDDGWSVDRDTYIYYSRALAADDDAELLLIPRKQRAEVRRSFTFDLATSTGRDERHRAAHYRVYSESVRNLGSPVFPRALFDAAIDGFGDDADILTVWRDGQPLASSLSLYWRGTMYPYWGGGTWDARRWRANDRMYYAMMLHGRRRGCERLDLGRSKTGTGAADFKHNFGFPARPLIYHKRSAPGVVPREINPLDPRFRRQIAAWQRLPLPIANRLGPMIARGLG